MVQQWEVTKVEIDRAHPEGAPCRFMGIGQWKRGGRCVGGFTRQALVMGHRLLLRQHSVTVDGDCWDFGV